MKAIKTSGVILVVFLLLGVYVYAQEQTGNQEQSITPGQSSAQQQNASNMVQKMNTDNMFQKMKTDLNLTQAQADAVKPIIEQNATKRKALMESLKQQGADKDTIRNQMEQLNQERDQQLSKILSPDQMDKLKTIKSERQHKGGRRHGGMPR